MNDTARKIDLSVVIVYTNVAQLNEAVSYIEKQSIYPSVETALLDNRENRFTARIFAFTILRTAAKTIFILRTAVTNPPATLSIRRSEKL